MTDLQEMQSYWTKKYPTVDVKLWSNKDNTVYYGTMINYKEKRNLQSSTIGELIGLGEKFLRESV